MRFRLLLVRLRVRIRVWAVRCFRNRPSLARRGVWLVASIGALWPCGVAHAQPVTLEPTRVFLPFQPHGPLHLEPRYTDRHEPPAWPARSWRALRDAGLVRQGFDYSCGSAALATLLQGGDEPPSETTILREVFAGLTEEEKARIVEAGVSLLDLKRVAERRGYRAEGYRVKPDFLPKLTRPVLVFIQPRGYKHFAVFRGVRGDRVFLANPARGNVRHPIWSFLDMWLDEQGRGVIFVVDSKASPLLALDPDAPTQPEILGVRELVAIGNPYARLPNLR